ncbi:MAG: DNA repair protein RadC [Magnetococcales bacterium]|nr:DNA repair protein RadC [Magnetococcales bacterium]
MHAGHRERLRKRFTQEGLEGFADHQVLELLLFHALPRRDTNPIAHLLLQRYGSLSGVFEADAADLALAPGVGSLAGLFLTLIPAVTRRYLLDSTNRLKPALNKPHKTKEYVLPLMAGRTEEVFYALCLDSRNRLIHPALVGEGTVRDVVVHPRQVVEAALRHRACSVILAHNHPSGNPRPSAADFQLTRELILALESIQIRVLDHVIVGGQEVVSLSEEGLLGE